MMDLDFFLYAILPVLAALLAIVASVTDTPVRNVLWRWFNIKDPG